MKPRFTERDIQKLLLVLGWLALLSGGSAVRVMVFIIGVRSIIACFRKELGQGRPLQCLVFIYDAD